MISNIIHELRTLNGMRATDFDAAECKFSRLIDVLIRWLICMRDGDLASSNSQLEQIEINLRCALTELEEQKKQIERLDKVTDEAVTLRGVM